MGKKIHRIDEITQRIVNKHLREAIDYGDDDRHRMQPSIERSLDQDTHPFGGSPSLPTTGTSQKYSEKLASKRFKDIVLKAKNETLKLTGLGLNIRLI